MKQTLPFSFESWKIAFDIVLTVCIIGTCLIFLQKENLKYFYAESFFPEITSSIKEEYRKVIKHFYTNLFIILSASFGLISIFFGLHTDIIIAYDKNEENIQEKPIREEYFWFFPSNALAFPIEQMNLEYGDIPLTNVDFSKYSTKKIQFTLTVCDFTPSTNPEIDSLFYEPLRMKLSASLEGRCDNIKELNIRDQIPLYIFSELTTIDTTNHYLSFMQFSGLPKKGVESIYEEHWQKIDNLSLCSDSDSKKGINFLQQYRNKINTLKKDLTRIGVGKTVSNFIEVVEGLIPEINEAKKKCSNQGIKAEDIYITINIISDFDHEPKSSISFEALENKIKDLANLNSIDRCNLLILPNFKNQSKEENIERTVKLFQNFFKKGRSIYCGTKIKSFAQKADEKVFSSIINTPSQKIPKLKIYYPYKLYQNQNTYLTKLLIENPSLDKDKKKVDYVFNFKSQNSFEKDSPEIYYHTYVDTKDKAVNFGEPTKFEMIDNIDTLSINYLPNNLEQQNDISFEIDYETKKIIYNVELLPTLPKTSSRFFLLLYCLFFTSFFLLIFFYLHEISLLKKNRGYTYKNFASYKYALQAFMLWSLIILKALVIIANIILVAILWWNYTIDISFKEFVSILILIIIIMSSWKFNKLWNLNKPFHEQPII